MVWEEVATALSENRRELVLSGSKINKRLSESGIDITLFHLKCLNYLSIIETGLSQLPDEFERLINLQSLVLHSNHLEELPPSIAKLPRLRLLDVSNNNLKSVPDISTLATLGSLNVSNNDLETFPPLPKLTSLRVINLSYNCLRKFPDVCHSHLADLQELLLNNNKIESIPSTIRLLSSLKVFRIDSNQLKAVPAELADLGKLKELNLKHNVLTDRRLVKLIDQNGSVKNILNHIKQNNKRSMVTVGSAANVRISHERKEREKTDTGVQHPPNKMITVKRISPTTVRVIVKDSVRGVRPHIVTCIITDIKFTEDIFSEFIRLQTKLHDTICNKRNAATIATHDWNKIVPGDMVYTAIPPKELKIQPLGSADNLVVGADQLVQKLRREADQIRKDKKRNTLPGLYKYLALLDNITSYPVLMNSKNEVISFPPITNSDITKISVDTTAILLEVTSPTSNEMCRKVADAILKESLPLFGDSITVQQIKNIDSEGNLKLLYPSYQDLIIEDERIIVERDYKL